VSPRVQILVTRLAIVLAVAAVLPGNIMADANYPDRTIKIVTGFPPGGAPDTTARLIADKLQAAWGKPVVVESIAGAGRSRSGREVAA
jgi:tripartite-type tricarboxylate transporter receptor subunit TctC